MSVLTLKTCQRLFIFLPASLGALVLPLALDLVILQLLVLLLQILQLFFHPDYLLRLVTVLSLQGYFELLNLLCEFRPLLHFSLALYLQLLEFISELLELILRSLFFLLFLKKKMILVLILAHVLGGQSLYLPF